MASQKGHHDICIFKAGDRFRVRPAVWTSDSQAHGNKPSEVTFRNLTDESVLLVFPKDMLYVVGSQGVNAQIQTQSPEVSLVPKRGNNCSTQGDVTTVTLAVKVPGDVPGVYPYSVIVRTNIGAVYASGESEPVVIIDPPPV
jgi:hypothetical protein